METSLCTYVSTHERAYLRGTDGHATVDVEAVASHVGTSGVGGEEFNKAWKKS